MQLRTIAIDISDAQLESAVALGADLVLNPKTQPDYLEKIKAATEDGAHAAVVFSAANAAYETAPDVLRYEYLRLQRLPDHEMLTLLEDQTVC